MTTILKIHSPRSGKTVTRQTRGYCFTSRLEGVEIQTDNLGTTQIKPPVGNYGSGDCNSMHHVLYKFPEHTGRSYYAYPREFIAKYATDMYKAQPDTALRKLVDVLAEWVKQGGIEDDLHPIDSGPLGSDTEVRNRSIITVPDEWIQEGRLPYTINADVKEICTEGDALSNVREEYEEARTQVEAMYASAQASKPEGHMVMKISLYEMFKTALESGAVLPAKFVATELFTEENQRDDDDWEDFESMLA